MNDLKKNRVRCILHVKRFGKPHCAYANRCRMYNTGMPMNMTTISNLFLTALLWLSFISTAVAQNNWLKHPSPVLPHSAIFPNWDGIASADAFVMADNDTLKMWYAGSGWTSATDTLAHVRVGYAWSIDGINWIQYANNPVVDISADTAYFDSDGIETPTVIKDMNAPPTERYKMWYAGRKSLGAGINDHKFGYAFSADGIHWTKYAGNPVLSAGAPSDWYNTFISGPSVIKDGNTYKMWFTAPDLIVNGQPTDNKLNIGYATSVDGIHWSVHPAAVLLAGAQNNWDSAAVAEPSVLKTGNTYHMWYSALDDWSVENFAVGYATSADGIHWTKALSNPVLDIGPPSDWDAYWATHPTVIFDSVSNRFEMWYTGRDIDDVAMGTVASLSDYFWDIGYAYANTVLGVKPSGTGNVEMAIFPNPTTGKLIFKTTSNYQELKISVYTIMGERVLKVKNQTEIDISSLSSGTYFLRVDLDGKIATRKIIKTE